MAPSTALLFILFGVAAFLRARLPLGRAAYRTGVVIASAGALVALLLLLLSLLGIRTGAEHLGFAVAGTVGEAPVGHMSPVTAICFLLASLSFLTSLPSSPFRPWRVEVAWWGACLLLATCSVLLLAYLFGTPLLYAGSMIPPAATTSIAFAALGTALLALAGKRGSRATPNAWIPYPLVLVFVLLATGIVTVGRLYFRSQEKQHREQVERQLSAVAELKTSELTQWRTERLGDASIFFENAAFSTLVRRAFGNPEDAEARAQLGTWLGKVQTHYLYDRIFLLDAQGGQRMSVPDSGASISSVIAQRAPEVLRSAAAAFQDFYRNEHDERVYLDVLVPILEAGGSRALGMLALRIDPETYLYPSIDRWPTPSRTAETLLLRREGGDALFLNQLRGERHTALRLRVPLESRDVTAVKAALGEEGIAKGRDYRGVPVVAAVRAVPGSPWFLVARMDAAEVNAPVRERLWVTIVLVSALLAAAAAGVGALWRQQRVRHLRERQEREQERAWLHDVIARSLNEVYAFDPDTLRFRFVNRGASRNLGYTQEELAELTPLDLKPEFTAESFRAMLEPLETGGRPVHVFETVHRRKDASTYPVEVHLQLVDAGESAVFLAIVNDISERRRADARIRHLNRVYAVLSDINQAIVRVREPRALFAEACRIAVEKGGFRLAWVGLLDPETKSVRPVAHAGVSAGYLEKLQIVSGGEPRGSAGGVLGVHAICNDIEHDPRMAPWRDDALARGYRAWAAFPLTVNGESLGTFNLYASEPGFFDGQELRLLDELAADLSFALEANRREEERRRSEEALRESERLLLASQRVGRLGTYVLDVRAGTWSSSETLDEIFGIDRDYPRTVPGWLAFVRAEDRAEMVEYLERHVIAGRQRFDREYRIIRQSDGEERWVHGLGDLELDPEGSPLRMIGTIQDVTERKRLESQVRQSQKMEAIGRLAGGVAHDFNNMLGVILGFAQLGLAKLDAGDPLHRHFTEIVQAAEKSADLTRQLLAFARRQTVAPQVVDLNDAIGSMGKMLGRLVGEDVELQVVPGEALWHARIDPAQVDQILANLVTNARDAIAGVGTITIETANVTLDRERLGRHAEFAPGEYVMLVVSDAGVGMDKATQERIFEPFFTTKPDGKGTGLGLATVYGIVKQNDGFVYVYSEPGQGTTFKIYLPRFVGEAEPAALEVKQGPLTGGETLLVVEDEPKLLALAREGLESLGYKVLAAATPGDAFLLFENHAEEIHLLVTDVVLPAMNGKELTLRLQRLKPGLRAVFVSGYTPDVVAQRGILDDDVAFVQKPFTLEALATKVREALDG
jgi:PAS domain S-box-containing protein